MYKCIANNWKMLYLEQLKLPHQLPILKIVMEQCDDVQVELVKLEGNMKVKQEVKPKL